MLNPRWEKVYDPKDFESWKRLEGTAPPITYPFQKQILYSLLAKYYRTNKGYELHPEGMRSSSAYFDMLARTMQQLERAILERDSSNETDWYEQRDKEEDLGARLTREDEMKRDASLKKISLREEIDLGRFWISPNGEAISPDKDLHHGEWIIQHPEVLSSQEQGLLEKYHGDIPKLVESLFADGWIRISGGIAEMYSDHQMPNLAKFLDEHVFETERDSQILVLQHDKHKDAIIKVADVISQYSNTLELQATLKESTKNAASSVPNPLRRNYDYSGEMGGPEWQNRVKNFMKRRQKRKSALENIINVKNLVGKIS